MGTLKYLCIIAFQFLINIFNLDLIQSNSMWKIKETNIKKQSYMESNWYTLNSRKFTYVDLYYYYLEFSYKNIPYKNSKMIFFQKVLWWSQGN